MTHSNLDRNVRRVSAAIAARMDGASRLVIGIARPPASGKSTLAEAVVAHLNRAEESPSTKAALLPMDGYHHDNRLLEARGLLARKGAPETFDAGGFCEAVSSLRSAGEEMFFPSFDRNRDMTVANSLAVAPDVKIIVVEGNYLLLRQAPWSALKAHFTVTVFLSPPLGVLEARLQRRWIEFGLDPEAARQRATRNDLVNARLVMEQSAPADILLDQS